MSNDCMQFMHLQRQAQMPDMMTRQAIIATICLTRFLNIMQTM